MNPLCLQDARSKTAPLLGQLIGPIRAALMHADKDVFLRGLTAIRCDPEHQLPGLVELEIASFASDPKSSLAISESNGRSDPNAITQYPV